MHTNRTQNNSGLAPDPGTKLNQVRGGFEAVEIPVHSRFI